MKMTPVKSSNIEAIGYNSATLDLFVEFKNGKTFSYKYVSRSEHSDLIQSESVGKHFNQFIKPGREVVEVSGVVVNEQHREDTKYSQWADVMLDDLECDYELALVENSLRYSVYFKWIEEPSIYDNSIGVLADDADYWCWHEDKVGVKLTRAQALYIATCAT